MSFVPVMMGSTKQLLGWHAVFRMNILNCTSQALSSRSTRRGDSGYTPRWICSAKAAEQGFIEAMLEAVRLCRLYDLEGATKLKIYAVEFYGPKFYSLPGVIWPEDRFLSSEIARFFSSDYDIFQFDFIVPTAAE